MIFQGKKINLRHFTMDVGNVRTHYSHQGKDHLIQLYKYRVEALMDKIEFLEAQLEVYKNNNKI